MYTIQLFDCITLVAPAAYDVGRRFKELFTQDKMSQGIVSMKEIESISPYCFYCMSAVLHSIVSCILSIC